ncbi:MAG: DNA-directed RNA polymerase subunit alpha [Thermogutta sp.]|uniref:DNA-directed RNA polymerase subunit alpha n=1 Tax=Thermogutta sp. TaxID=1962930 RepID=UPI00198CE674|nr:DNA-directed RNA polymerase subunit alpha [Thermogutta sp.]MBC7352110.1 DNA-directed RNA polymerase subunit alpha [Thermogutta sp.]
MRVRWRGLELPSQVICDKSTLTDRYGKFIAEPFERGFGTTIGNSLRRILLSSLEGSAVTRVKIQGALHEITSLPGVVEDVTDIILNVKSLVVRNHSSQPRILRINRHTRGVVTAADIEPDDQVTIVNKDHVIATLTDDVPFVMEMTVENGRGYVPASEHTPQISEIGVIPVDAMFSPVVKVRYEVEETRVGQKTNYDKLTLEIWTDGSITPEMALVEAAKILRKHLNPFVQYNELGPKVFTDGRSVAGVEPSQEAKLAMPVTDLRLSARTLNALELANIRTVRDLVSHTEEQLLELRNFGETALAEVKEKLAALGLRLGMRSPATSGGAL